MGTARDAENSSPDQRTYRDLAPDAFVEMDPQRMLEVQLRIATGFYERPSVLRATAERILQEGDLPPTP